MSKMKKLSPEEVENLYTALMSEQALAEDWLNKKDEEAWKDL